MKKQIPISFSHFLSGKNFCSSIVFAFITLFTFKTYAQQWSMLGNGTQISTVASSYTTITVVNDVPYVVYVETASTSGIAKVKKKNYSTGAWDQVGANVATNASYTRIYSDKNGKLYVTYIDAGNSSRLAVATYNTATQTWDPLSSGNLYVSTGSATYTTGGANIRTGLAFDGNDIPYVAYSERTSTMATPYLKRFVSGAWETVGGAAISADLAIGNGIVMDENDVPYVVYIQLSSLTATSGVVKTFRINTTSNTWEDVSPPSPVLPGTTVTTGARHTTIAMDSVNNPIVSYSNASSSLKATVIRYNKTTAAWNFVGTPSTRDANSNTIINDNGGNVYNLFTDALINGGRANMVRLFKLNRSAAAFAELKNPTFDKGIDSTGANTTVARDTVISDIAVAVGSDTSEPFIVYTKTISGGTVRTPIVQFFIQPVITRAITNLTMNSATSGGNVSNLGGTITERGVVYGTSPNPTTADTKIIDASGNTIYTSNLTGLAPGTQYYARAYAINSAGINYGNTIIFVTPAPASNSVTLVDNGTTVVMSNGIVKATITKATARVTSLIYNGLEMLKGQGTGNVYWSWQMDGRYHEPSGCTYTLTANPNTNNFDYAEIKLRMTYDAAATSAAMDVDIYYSLPKDASGLYAAATLTHPASYPALSGGEWRMASSVNDRFDWLTVDSLRNRMMPSAYDAANSVAVSGAPDEVTRYTTGIYANKYECKYDYSADFGETNVWGWSSTTDKVGIWVTAPSKEYYPGGPRKRELMSHGTTFLLNMIGGTHYGQGAEVGVAAGEEWQKNYGPFLIYCNKVAAGTANANNVLWEDAKAQTSTEQTTWPYTWFTNPTYIKESGRGTVTGKLVINDAGNPSASAANTWVGLGIPPAGTSSSVQFQRWSKNYQFWVKTDAAGNFTIPHVLPGTYSLFAFGPGANGQLSLSNYATVTASSTTALGDVSWTPTRVASTVWEIGIPDRNAMEFKHGTDWWTSGTYPDTRWGKFLYYPDEFPSDVNFTIGQSTITNDWNFVHYWDKNVRATSPAWKVNFNLAAAPTTGSTASVYVALAENNGSALILSVNGTNVSVPTTGASLSDNANSMIRKGIHGGFCEVRFSFPASYLQAGNNQISFTLRVTGSNTVGDVMYDYVRLEAAGTSAVILPMELSPLSGKKTDKANVLNWSTANEQNTTIFQVLRGQTTNPTEVIGTVTARGNSTVYTPYTFTDKGPLAGPNYYRLKMVDKDGKTTYSNTIFLKTTANSGIVIYPNPVSSQLTVRSATGITIGAVKLYDAKGSVVYSAGKVGATQTTINVASLPAGLYTVEVRSGDKVITEKINKQ